MDMTDGTDANGPAHNTANNYSRSLFHRLAGRLPLILLLWLLVCVPLTYLAYVLIEPTYEASSTLRIEPTKPELFGPTIRSPGVGGVEAYLETQRQLILTDRVIDEALADAALRTYPILNGANATDPIIELRKKLDVKIIPNTYLIRVSYSSNEPGSPGAIVKAVVDSFMRQHRDFNLGDTDSLKQHYEGYLKQLDVKIDQKRLELVKLAEKEDQAALGKSDIKGQPSHVNAVKADFVKDDLKSSMEIREVVVRKLEQLKFESSNQLVGVFLQDPASPPKAPRANDRPLYMAMVPIVTLFVLLGLFLLLEIRAIRRAIAP
jgi:polysaccharide biosynthesis transport protein